MESNQDRQVLKMQAISSHLLSTLPGETCLLEVEGDGPILPFPLPSKVVVHGSMVRSITLFGFQIVHVCVRCSATYRVKLTSIPST